jgi:SAM-dependent methyltransferase
MASERDYEGTELELFQAAVNWKAYWSDKVAPYVRGAALEVGAGLGANIANFRGKSDVQWTLLEPDRAMCEEMSGRARAGLLPPGTEVVCGMLGDLPAGRTYDSILYIDVLEHIEDDRAELERAAARLAPGGHLIVLSPAYQSVYSPFDKAIGHFRRYDRKGLLALTPPSLRPARSFYLDSLGLMLSAVNRFVARQSSPTPATIKVWDRTIVPLSRIADPLVGHGFGRSIVAVWTRPV